MRNRRDPENEIRASDRYPLETKIEKRGDGSLQILNARMGFMMRILVFLSALLLFVGLLMLQTFAMTQDGKIVIVLDPGHAEGDGGGTSLGTYPEYWYNMQVAKACKNALVSTGWFEVYLTHEDTSTPMSALERTLVADRANADLVLSIHFDGSFDSRQNGVETFVSVLPEYRLYDLGYRLLHNLSSRTGMTANDVYMREDTGDGEHVYYWDYERAWDVPDDATVGPLSDYYGMITWPAKFGIPAIIIKHGFLSNYYNRVFADDLSNLTLLGQIDAQTVYSYYFGHTHVFTEEKTVDYPSNCCFVGKRSYRCEICKCRLDTESLEPDPDNHWYLATGHVGSTCSEPGYDECICRYTDNLRSRDYPIEQHTERHYLPLLDHKGILKSDGDTFSVICSECGELMFGPADSEGHDYRLTSCLKPDCGNPGVVRVRCKDCNLDRIMTVQPTGMHTYVTISERLPSCTQDGERNSKCSGCGRTLTETLPAVGHDYLITEEVPATCESAGHRLLFCENCMESKTEELPQLGHRYVSTGIWIQEPTLFSDGIREIVCERDPSHKSQETVPALRLREWLALPDGYLTCVSIGAALLLAVFSLWTFRKNAKRTETGMEAETKAVSESNSEESDPGKEETEEGSVLKRSDENEHEPSEIQSNDRDSVKDTEPENSGSVEKRLGRRRARRNPHDDA